VEGNEENLLLSPSSCLSELSEKSRIEMDYPCPHLLHVWGVK